MKTERGRKQGWLSRNFHAVIYPACMVFLVIAIAMAMVVPAAADDTGWVGIQVAEAGSGTVTDPGNVFSADGSYAVFDSNADWERYGFSTFPTIPAGAIITGIEVRLLAHQTDHGQDLNVSLSKDGGLNYTAPEKTPDFPTGDTNFDYESVGGNGDLWGTSWSPGDFTTSNFKIRLYGTDSNTSRQLWLDYFEVKVYYTCSYYGPNFGTGTAEVGPHTWQNPNYVLADDANAASVLLPDHTTSNYLKVDHLNFNIPADAAITGIQVDVKRKADSTDDQGIYDVTASLVDDNGTILTGGGSNLKMNDEWSTDATVVTYGGPSEMWKDNYSWTPAMINSNNFGFALRVENKDDGANQDKTAYVYYVTVTIYYECPCEEGGGEKVDPVCTVTGYDVIYDGNEHTATVESCTCKDVDVSADVDLSGTAHTDAGTYNGDTWTYNDTTGNCNDITNGTVDDQIDPADPSCTVTPYHVTYDATAHTATGSCYCLSTNTTDPGLNLSGTTHTNAGTYSSDSWTYTDPTGNCNNDGDTITDIIDPATLTCTADDATVQYSDNVPTFGLVGGVCTGYVDSENFDSSDLTGTLSCDTTASTSDGMVTECPGGGLPATFNINCSGYTSTNYSITWAPGTLTVNPEDATVDYPFSGDPSNPSGLKVVSDGGDADAFDLYVYVMETLPDTGCTGSCPGEIDNADVDITLTPVGPGSQVSANSCVKYDDNGETGYDKIDTWKCCFDAGVPVNTYSVGIAADHCYTGSDEEVLTIFDPSLGFTTGGGWFYWPPTEEQLGIDPEYPGDRTNFGYTMKYNTHNTSKPKGSLLVIRHTWEGTYRNIYRVKSNALTGLALGSGNDCGWATFSGKSTYIDPDMYDAEGNYKFIVYVEDCDTPGSAGDSFWLQVKDKDNVVVPPMSLDMPAYDNTIQLEGGNIVVPH